MKLQDMKMQDMKLLNELRSGKRLRLNRLAEINIMHKIIFVGHKQHCTEFYRAVSLCPIHTADADETKLSSRVASAVCTRIRN